jgi:hypothetical protein
VPFERNRKPSRSNPRRARVSTDTPESRYRTQYCGDSFQGPTVVVCADGANIDGSGEPLENLRDRRG